MRKISAPVLKKITEDEFYKKCVRHRESTCQGRITYEHCFIYAGSQLDEAWAIVPLCAFHHSVDQFQDGGDLRKGIGQLVALQRATDDELNKYPRADWKQLKKRLESEYADYA